MIKIFIVTYIVFLLGEIIVTYRNMKKEKSNGVSFFMLPIIGFAIIASATSNREITKADLAILSGVFAICYAIYCGVCVLINKKNIGLHN